MFVESYALVYQELELYFARVSISLPSCSSPFLLGSSDATMLIHNVDSQRPCCVWAKQFPNRKNAAGELVRHYAQLMDYLQGKDTRITRYVRMHARTCTRACMRPCVFSAMLVGNRFGSHQRPAPLPAMLHYRASWSSYVQCMINLPLVLPR